MCRRHELTIKEYILNHAADADIYNWLILLLQKKNSPKSDACRGKASPHQLLAVAVGTESTPATPSSHCMPTDNSNTSVSEREIARRCVQVH